MKLKELFFKYYQKYKEIITYVFYGGLTTVVNYLVFVIFNLLNYQIEISVTFAWIAAVIFAYFTNKIYVFKSKSFEKSVIIKEAISFLSFRVFSLFVDLAIMYLFVTVLGYNEYIMKILSNVVIVVINYIASKLFIFKKK